MHNDVENKPHTFSWLLLALVFVGAGTWQWLEPTSLQDVEPARQQSWELRITESDVATTHAQGSFTMSTTSRATDRDAASRKHVRRGKGAADFTDRLRKLGRDRPQVDEVAAAREKRAAYLKVMERTAKLEGLDVETRRLGAHVERVKSAHRPELLAETATLRTRIQGALDHASSGRALDERQVRETSVLQDRTARLRIRVEEQPATM
ncbi:MAG: hypothetical protein AB2A00_35680 [Myxococcota bacterium]